jgi:hypothetical protein
MDLDVAAGAPDVDCRVDCKVKLGLAGRKKKQAESRRYVSDPCCRQMDRSGARDTV